MISAKFPWGNVFFGEKLQIDTKISNFEFFESALYMKSVSMPLICLPQPSEIWTKLDDPNYIKVGAF